MTNYKRKDFSWDDVRCRQPESIYNAKDKVCIKNILDVFEASSKKIKAGRSYSYVGILEDEENNWA